MSKVSYYTKSGFKKLKQELNHLKDVERPRASKAIAEARDKGDLSENAEYDAAKEAQGLLELRISKLEEILSSARKVRSRARQLSRDSDYCKNALRGITDNVVGTGVRLQSQVRKRGPRGNNKLDQKVNDDQSIISIIDRGKELINELYGPVLPSEDL